MQLIEERMEQSLPLGQIEQRLQETSFALANFRQALHESHIPESPQLEREFDGIRLQFDAILANRQRWAHEDLAAEFASEVRSVQEMFPCCRTGAKESEVMKLVRELGEVELGIAAASEPAGLSSLIGREAELVAALTAATDA
jgi:hypothetical protein